MGHVVAPMVEIIQRYLDEQLLDDDDDIKPHIQSFLAKACSFRDFLVGCSTCLVEVNQLGRVDELIIRIVDNVHKAEDVVELHIIARRYNQHPAGDHEQDVDVIQELDRVAKEFESIKQEILDKSGQRPTNLLPLDSSPPLLFPASCRKKRKKNDALAIYEDDFQALKSRLINQQPPSRRLQITTIVGMNGMGKRTLALRLYNDPSVADRLPARAWVNAFMVDDVKVILLNLLKSLGIVTWEMRRQTADQLGEHVFKALRNRKYFIVLHDLYCRVAKFILKRFFPDDHVGSRIILTNCCGCNDGEIYRLRFLTDSESWLVFCQNLFGKDHCPDHELESIGKVILGYCKGITQLVSLIAGLLATSEKTPTFWELVAAALSSTLEGQQNREIIQIGVLQLIYNNSAYYLKPCVLYMGALEDCSDIQASTIIKLWIAEGFINQTADNRSLEDIAEAYLEVLIDKNLLSLTRQDPTGRVKAVQIQPFLRLCYVVIACQQKFLWSKDIQSHSNNDDKSKTARRVSGRTLLQHSNKVELSSLTRSFVSTGQASPLPIPVFVKLILLRVLDVFQLELYQFPLGMLQLLLLRYLAFSCHSNTPTSISRFWNVQSLIIRRLPWFRAFCLPIELLQLERLKHVKCKETFVWRYPDGEKKLFHSNLETLSNMQLLGVTTEFFEQIPNIKKLGIFGNTEMQNVLDLTSLDKLEKLKCSSDWSLASTNFLSSIMFPSSLKKLTLSLCRIPWGFMKVVGELSNLEELKLQKGDFLVLESGPAEPEWEPAEDEFPRLISLVMKDLNLVHWKARASHFPRLRELIVLNCYAMIGLPADIGDIQTLELLHVNKHSPSVVASAMQIRDKYAGSGKEYPQVLITKNR